MRLFVAVFPPEDHRGDLRRVVTDALARAGPKVRLTPVDRWHITLAFLGEVDSGRLPDVTDALSTVDPPGPVTLRMSGGGAFGKGRSTVLWAGIDGDLVALGELQGRVMPVRPGPWTNSCWWTAGMPTAGATKRSAPGP